MRLLFLALLTATALAQPRWQPDRSYVLVASITNWPQAAELPGFPAERRDADLVRAFEQAGVPRSQVVFLTDSQAKRPSILRELAGLAKKCQPEDTLFFYFQGHAQPGLFCTYDYESKRPKQTGLRTAELYPLLRNWKGQQLFLIGDCCSSGSLQTVVRQFEYGRPEVRVAGIASTTASSISTTNWTFTEGLLRILGGDPVIDQNQDGQISLGEGDVFLHDQMKSKENQLCSLSLTRNFASDFIWRAATPAGPAIKGTYKRGDIVSAQDKIGKWYPSEILDEKDGLYKVHYHGWESKWDEWVEPAKLKPFDHKPLDLSASYLVQRNGKWYHAVLTSQAQGYFYYAHYLQEAGESDEWITPDRARAAPPQPEAYQAARAGAVHKWVAAQWHKHWFRARVTGRADGLFKVIYDDKFTGRLSQGEVIPIVPPKVGERVLAVRLDDGHMYPGRWNGTTVKWEDGQPPSQVPPEKLTPIR